MLLLSSDTAGPYATAVIAAVGVLAGGMITAATNLFVERQRRRQADEARAAVDSRELRQAVRIVLEELSEAEQTLMDDARLGLELREGPPMPVGAWSEHRVVLAGFLSDEAWRWGTLAVRTIAELNADRDADYTVELAELRSRWATIRQAMEVLERELARQTGATRGGVFQYTGYASADEVWPEGGKPYGSPP